MMKTSKLYITLLTFICYPQTNSAEPMEAIYWIVEPFVFQKSAKELTGIIPEFYEILSQRCYKSKPLVQYRKRIGTQKEFTDLLHNTFGLGLYSNVTWFPLLQLRNETLLKEKYTFKTFLYSTGIVVITKRDQIILFHRLWLGVISSCYIIVIAIVPTVLFAFLIWIPETYWNPKVFDRTFVKGVGTGLWWGIVTLTKVGYGDTEIKSLFGRSVATLWMLLALITSALVTATIINAVNGKEHLDITKKTI